MTRSIPVHQTGHGGYSVVYDIPLTGIPMTKHRSRRQRKKLHIGEFQEFGFAIKTQLKADAREEVFVDTLLEEVIEPHGLEFGGWANGGFITKAVRGSVSAADREAVITWLRTRPDVQAARVSELVDAWNTDFVADEALTSVMA